MGESAESAEWGATPDGGQPTAVGFFPVTAPTVPMRSDVLAPETGDAQSDVLASSADDELLVDRAWFLQPSAATWLLPLPYTSQDVSSTKPTPLIDNVVEEVSFSEAVSSPQVHTSKIATPTRASLVQLTSCGG